jgi:hypothetical protein
VQNTGIKKQIPEFFYFNDIVVDMNSPRSTRLLACLVFTGMGLVLLTHLVRPNLIHPLPAIGFLFGLLPNFGSALGFSGLFALFLDRFLRARSHQLSTMKVMLAAVGFSVLVLFAWELEGYLFSHLPIDPYDLLATLIGGACALILQLIFKKQR